MNKRNLLLLTTLLILLSVPGHATWSIIAVDRNTGEIGIAGASCTYDVSGIAYIVPAKGAVVVQAASNYAARMNGVRLMYGDSSPHEIMRAMMDEEFEPEKQQYGLIVLEEGTLPLVYSGNQITDWSGEKLGSDFAVMGNILPSGDVVAEAWQAFDRNRELPLADRLMVALRAGEQAGGDRRCGTQYARSAFIMIYQPEHGAITKLAIQGLDEGGEPAVSLLEEQFSAWRAGQAR